MYVAIKYEKINLWDDMYIFKPISVIKGTYDKETFLIETEYKDVCVPINGSMKDEDSYFGEATTEEDLLLEYEGLTYEEALQDYFDECCNNFTLGYFDYTSGRINVLNIPFSTVQKHFINSQDHFYIDQDTVKLSCSLDFINALRYVDNIEDVHKILDAILGEGDFVVNELNKINSSSRLECNGDNNENEYEVELEKKDIYNFFNEDESSNQKITAENSLLLNREESKEMTLKELRKEVKDVIKGQDKAVDDVTRTLIMNQKSKNPRHKSHILITGPSGTGKTEMINIISKRLGIPYFKADATAYTKEGYVGKSVYSMISGLIASVDGDIKKAQNGILIIDEIDKKLTSEEDWVGGVEIFNALLKIMDRDIVEVDTEEGMVRKKILFDTSNLTIIFMGAFAKLYEEKNKSKEETKAKTIGFGSAIKTEDKEEKEEKQEKTYLTNEDLIKAGVPPEFLGRVPVIQIQMH